LDSQEVPGGLLLGSTRIWGYARGFGEPPLTLGVFVTPAVAPRALSHVVLWRVANAATLATSTAKPARSVERRSGVLHELPGASNGRHLLVTTAAVVAGAAVVQHGRLLGSVRPLAFGSALMTSFAASRQPWNLLLLPDDPAQRPLEVHGVVVRGEAGQVRLRVVASVDAAPHAAPLLRGGAGQVFTGTNGIHCPAGLQVGRYSVDPDDPAGLVVVVPELSGPQAVDVLVAGGGS
jgi:hypothetical protein